MSYHSPSLSSYQVARVEDVAVRLTRGGIVVGRRFTAGPCVSSHPWAVYGRGGQPIARTHDSFESARLFVLAEDSDLDTDEPIALPTDAEISARAYEDRCDEYRWMYGAFIDYQRERLAAARARFLGAMGLRTKETG